MQQIAPSEREDIAVFDGTEAPLSLCWRLTQVSLDRLFLFVIPTAWGLETSLVRDRNGQLETVNADRSRLASPIHTDDEIARKILAQGAVLLERMQTASQALGATANAVAYERRRDSIRQDLAAWAAGSSGGQPTHAATGPSPHPSSAHPRAANSTAPSSGDPTSNRAPERGPQLDLERDRIRAAKDRNTGWLLLNIVIPVLILLSTIGMFASAGPGDRVAVWWGPFVFCAINAFRLGAKRRSLFVAERALS